MSDYSDLEYAMANDQEAVYELTDLVAEQEEAISSLREQVKVLREALGWLVNEMDCRDDEFGGCLFTRQDFKIARDAIEQTNPNPALESKA